MKNALVMTSIHKPNGALRQFRDLGIFDTVVVVGDKKTPPDWDERGVIYLAPEIHDSLAPAFAGCLRWNHYSRKMIGYLYAIRNGATLIYETDDDNHPESWFSQPDLREGQLSSVAEGRQGFVNVYREFTAEHIWPRGLPLHLIAGTESLTKLDNEKVARFSVVQGLANGSPDVDAIYRLVGMSEDVTFSRKLPILLEAGTISPINSQNTWFAESAFPLLYLPSTVSFRFTDILRGVVAQPIMWRFGQRVLFTEATVRQLRNPHESFKDFVDEVSMYLRVEEAFEVATSAALNSGSVSSALFTCYSELAARGIVQEAELVLVEAWLAELGLYSGR